MKAGYDIAFTHTGSGSMLKIDVADAASSKPFLTAGILMELATEESLVQLHCG